MGIGQSQVIDFLGSPEAHPEAKGGVRRIDTHAALIFLAGDRAYKLKRAVKLPYLDFSDVDRRREVLLRELEINSKTSTGLYLAVEPITRARPGRFRIGGRGKPVDWVLVMRRFDNGALLDRIAQANALDSDLLTKLAEAIEHFHRTAAPDRTFDWTVTLNTIEEDIASTLTTDLAHSIGLTARPYLERLRAEILEKTALLAGRAEAGFVRRCHGDLHLKNIVLLDGRPTLFDAIEFSETLATIDVLYDLAFLLMDLIHRGLGREANLLLNHYMQKASIAELSGLAALPLYLSMRAGIRAMVGVHGLSFTEAAGREQAIAEIKSYAGLAERLLHRPRPRLIAIGGLSGAGKTSVSRQVAPDAGGCLGAVHIRSDVERKVMHGCMLTERLPSAAYTLENSEEVYRRLAKKAEVILDAGHSVIVDAVFPNERLRRVLCDIADRAGAAFSGFWLEAPSAVLKERVSARLGDASDADVDIVVSQARTVAEPAGWTRIETSGGLEKIGQQITQALPRSPD